MTDLTKPDRVTGKFTRLIKLSKDEDIDKRFAKGFPERARKREAVLTEKAKKQSPNADFMNREYTI